MTTFSGNMSQRALSRKAALARKASKSGKKANNRRLRTSRRHQQTRRRLGLPLDRLPRPRQSRSVASKNMYPPTHLRRSPVPLLLKKHQQRGRRGLPPRLRSRTNQRTSLASRDSILLPQLLRQPLLTLANPCSLQIRTPFRFCRHLRKMLPRCSHTETATEPNLRTPAVGAAYPRRTMQASCVRLTGRLQNNNQVMMTLGGPPTPA